MKQTKRFILIIILLLTAGAGQVLLGDGFIIVPHGGRIFPPPRPRPRPFPPPPNFNPFPLEVHYHHVKTTIHHQVAVTAIDQVFYNPTHRRLEGYYLFPIPKHAVIKKFSMFVNGKELEAELLDAKKARSIYEGIVRRHRDPALLEYSETGLFKARIFPIEPRSEKRVKITYHQVLEKDNHTIEYVYPLNTEKFSAKPLEDVSIHVDIQSPEDIKTVYCPTHNVEVIRKGKRRAVIGYEEKHVKPDRDFKLYYGTHRDTLGFSLLSYKKSTPRSDGYFLLNLSPGFAQKETISEKDITFVLDVSGSMAGEKLKQAKKALLFCIENLNPGDRFEIIRFSTEAEALFEGFAEVKEKNLSRAREFIRGLRPIGGTNIDEALGMAMKMKKRRGYPYMVIFLTDGKPTIGETDEKRLLANLKNYNNAQLRVFTFGIGFEINTHLLDKITQMTRASRTYVSPQEDIEVKVSNFYSRVQSPILTDLELSFGKGIRVSKMYPLHLPDLFKGSSITILGRYRGHGDADIRLQGKVKDKTRTFDFRAPDAFKAPGDGASEKNGFIPSLWAARRVGYLLDQVRLHGKDKELVDEIVQLARTYGIVTPYTSYLIVEDEEDKLRRRMIRREHQTLNEIGGRYRELSRNLKREYDNMALKSGAPSVKASEEVRDLSGAFNRAQMAQGKKRLNFSDARGKTRNLSQQYKNIQGRAVYNVGKFWVDSQIQQQKNPNALKRTRIQFGGKEYFQLLKDQPMTAQFLALGQNVRFIHNNKLYEIYE